MWNHAENIPGRTAPFRELNFYSTLLRKSCRRGSFGLSKICCGVPSSSDAAVGHEQRRGRPPRGQSPSHGSRRPSSCPPSPGRASRSSTSPTISGSSAEVGSSKSMTSGSMHEGADDGDTLLLSAGEHGRDTRSPCRPGRCARAAPSACCLAPARGSFSSA